MSIRHLSMQFLFLIPIPLPILRFQFLSPPLNPNPPPTSKPPPHLQIASPPLNPSSTPQCQNPPSPSPHPPPSPSTLEPQRNSPPSPRSPLKEHLSNPTPEGIITALPLPSTVKGGFSTISPYSGVPIAPLTTAGDGGYHVAALFVAFLVDGVMGSPLPS